MTNDTPYSWAINKLEKGSGADCPLDGKYWQRTADGKYWQRTADGYLVGHDDESAPGGINWYPAKEWDTAGQPGKE